MSEVVDTGARIAVAPRLLSISDAAKYIAVSQAHFFATWLKNPRLRIVSQGRRRLVDRDSLDRLVDELVRAPSPGA